MQLIQAGWTRAPHQSYEECSEIPIGILDGSAYKRQSEGDNSTVSAGIVASNSQLFSSPIATAPVVVVPRALLPRTFIGGEGAKDGYWWTLFGKQATLENIIKLFELGLDGCVPAREWTVQSRKNANIGTQSYTNLCMYYFAIHMTDDLTVFERPHDLTVKLPVEKCRQKTKGILQQGDTWEKKAVAICNEHFSNH